MWLLNIQVQKLHSRESEGQGSTVEEVINFV